ncbi:MAG: alpha/beta fold hydrolase [Candidatus Sericytochromatia bacterium]|nr:alpha/beta fold hydrolase [Candidatus Sericytochromatia bacterium]
MIAYQILGEPEAPALVLLHGLYGYGRNWLAMGRSLAADHWVILPDLRNHGSSFHAETWDYPSMAADIAELAEALELQSFALLGHSMGGKAAMQYALHHGAERLSQLVVADISHRAYDAAYHQRLLSALSQLDLQQINARSEASELLAAAIPEAAVRQFLLSNLRRDPQQGWAWQFNLPVLQKGLPAITAALDLQGHCFAGPTLFLGGGNSDYLRPEDLSALQPHFPRARAQWIPDAGHWLHADQPEAVEAALRRFLQV